MQYPFGREECFLKFAFRTLKTQTNIAAADLVRMYLNAEMKDAYANSPDKVLNKALFQVICTCLVAAAAALPP